MNLESDWIVVKRTKDWKDGDIKTQYGKRDQANK